MKKKKLIVLTTTATIWITCLIVLGIKGIFLGCATSRLKSNIAIYLREKNNPLLEIKDQEYSGTCKYDPKLDKYYVENLLFGEGRIAIISVKEEKYFYLEEANILPSIPLKKVPLRITTVDLQSPGIDNQSLINGGIVIGIEYSPHSISLIRLKYGSRRDYWLYDSEKTQLNFVRRKHKTTAGFKPLWFLVTVPVDIVTAPLQLLFYDVCFPPE